MNNEEKQIMMSNHLQVIDEVTTKLINEIDNAIAELEEQVNKEDLVTNNFLQKIIDDLAPASNQLRMYRCFFRNFRDSQEGLM